MACHRRALLATVASLFTGLLLIRAAFEEHRRACGAEESWGAAGREGPGDAEPPKSQHRRCGHGSLQHSTNPMVLHIGKGVAAAYAKLQAVQDVAIRRLTAQVLPHGDAMDMHYIVSDTGNDRIAECYLTRDGPFCKTVVDTVLEPQSVALQHDADGKLFYFIASKDAEGKILRCPAEREGVSATGPECDAVGERLDDMRCVALEGGQSGKPLHCIVAAGNNIQRCLVGGLGDCEPFVGAASHGSSVKPLSPASVTLVRDRHGETVRYIIADTKRDRIVSCPAGATGGCKIVVGPGELLLPYGVVLDRGHGEAVRYIIADTYHHRILSCPAADFESAVDPEGCTTVVGVKSKGLGGSGDRELRYPFSVILQRDADGTTVFIVADTGNDRIQLCREGDTACVTIAGPLKRPRSVALLRTASKKTTPVDRLTGIIVSVVVGFLACFGVLVAVRRWQARRPAPVPPRDAAAVAGDDVAVGRLELMHRG